MNRQQNIAYLIKSIKARGDNWSSVFKSPHPKIVLLIDHPYSNYWNQVKNTISMQLQFII